MHVIARPQLIKFYQRKGCKDAKGPIDAWWHEAKKANWQSWPEIRAQYGSASILKNNRIVFNLGALCVRVVVASIEQKSLQFDRAIERLHDNRIFTGV